MLPRHDYYIAREDEDKAAKASKKKRVNASLAKLTEIDDLSDDTVVKFMKVVGSRPTQSIDREDAYKELDAMIKTPGKAGIREFNATYKMWKDKASRSEFNARVIIRDYLNSRIVFNRASEYSWQPPRDEVGKTPPLITWARLSELVDFMLDPKFQEERDIMKKQYKAKMVI